MNTTSLNAHLSVWLVLAIGCILVSGVSFIAAVGLRLRRATQPGPLPASGAVERNCWRICCVSIGLASVLFFLAHRA
jgi:hypothetical protein